MSDREGDVKPARIVEVVQFATGYHVVPSVARSCRLEIWGADSSRVTIETTLNGTDVGRLITAFTDDLDVQCLAGPLSTKPCSDGSSMTSRSTLLVQRREFADGVFTDVSFILSDTIRSLLVNKMREISKS